MTDLVDMLESFRPLMDAENFNRLKSEMLTSVDTSLRFNPLKVDPIHSPPGLAQRYAWETRPIPFCPTGIWVKTAGVPPARTLEHHLGHFYIQEAASMLPAELFDFLPGSRPVILDMAASPGGKTTHLASRIHDDGLIIANDSSYSRLTALRLVLQTWGAAGMAVTGFPGEKYGLWFPGKFDAVLLDAPCSMQGLRSSGSHPIRPITPREQTSLAIRQERLLISALQAVRPGGQVVYSTCTLTPQENEGVLDALLRKYPTAFTVDDISTRLPAPAPGFPGDAAAYYHPAVRRAARIWPHLFGTAGFFAARLTSLESLPVFPQKPPGRPLQVAGFSALNSAEVKQLHSQLVDYCGFHLLAAINQRCLVLWRRGSVIHAFPEQYLSLFETFPCQALGLPLAEATPEGLLLSHEFVSRFFTELPLGRIVLPDALLPAWFRGEDVGLEYPPGLPPNRFVIVTDPEDRYLGRGKWVPGRLKNLLPRRITSARIQIAP